MLSEASGCGCLFSSSPGSCLLPLHGCRQVLLLNIAPSRCTLTRYRGQSWWVIFFWPLNRSARHRQLSDSLQWACSLSLPSEWQGWDCTQVCICGAMCTSDGTGISPQQILENSKKKGMWTFQRKSKKKSSPIQKRARRKALGDRQGWGGTRGVLGP